MVLFNLNEPTMTNGSSVIYLYKINVIYLMKIGNMVDTSHNLLFK